MAPVETRVGRRSRCGSGSLFGDAALSLRPVPEVRMAPVGERRSGLKVSAAGLEGGGSPPVETASSSSWIGAAQRVVEETFGSAAFGDTPNTDLAWLGRVSRAAGV